MAVASPAQREAKQLLLHIGWDAGIGQILDIMPIYAESRQTFLRVGCQDCQAKYTAPGLSVPLNPQTAFGVSGSISIVSEP